MVRKETLASHNIYNNCFWELDSRWSKKYKHVFEDKHPSGASL